MVCLGCNTEGATSKIRIFHQDHKREDKAYIPSHFLHHFITTSEYLNKLNAIAEIKHFTCKRVYTFQVHKFYLAVGNKHMIRVTAET